MEHDLIVQIPYPLPYPPLKTSFDVTSRDLGLLADMSDDVSTTPDAAAAVDAGDHFHNPSSVSAYHAWRSQASKLTQSSPNVPSAEKDADDPTVPYNPRASLEREHTATPARLNRLFASPPSPISSREASFSFAHPSKPYTRSMQTETAPLQDHLYSRGLLSGRHSDITVKVFGKDYALHRIILDRAPFFASALSEPWLEASSRAITLHPEEADINITQEAFELALTRLYGCDAPDDHNSDHCALLATGSWLEMQDIVYTCTEAILKEMHPRNLGPTIQFAANSYYGKACEKILASAKAMLCRDGWTMPLSYWDAVPSDVVREIVGGDSFYISDEWERFELASQILNRRLQQLATDDNLSAPAPKTLRGRALRIRLSARGATPSSRMVEETMNELALDLDEPDMQDWLALYTNPDIEALLLLLDEGIHYTHLDFERLQAVRSAKDVFGIPVMLEDVVSNALWKSVELRQAVLNSAESDEDLGLTQSVSTAEFPGGSVHELAESALPITSESQARRFWIPSTDCNITVGGSGDPVITAAGCNAHKSSNHGTDTFGHTDAVQWFSDFIKERSQASTSTRPTSYSTLPPFRFAAEFPHPRTLKEKKRVYSQTVFYAGSFWNVYVQKVKSAAKAPQLGVYLHRARSNEGEETRLSASGMRHSVDDRIGTLEKEMHRRRRASHRRHRSFKGDTSLFTDGDADDMTAGHLPDTDPTLAIGNVAPRHGHTDKSPGDHSRPRAANAVPALPPYCDTRPTIKTYFKIYSPSKGGRMLSVYESAPDCFNFSQSWGWKSSTLMVDEGLSVEPPFEGVVSEDEETLEVGLLDGESAGEAGAADKGRPRKRDGRLRFMIVLGVV